MTTLRETLAAAIEALWPFVPPALGAFIGLRYAAEQSKRDRSIAWLCSAVAGIYLGAAIGEHLALGPKTTTGVGFIIAMLGAELAGVAVAALRQWSADPVGTFRKWRDAWLGRGP